MVWPFRNLEKGQGPYELFLDNNAVVRSEWLRGLKLKVTGGIALNPTLAWVEQWLSNASFRDNAEGRINDFLAPFIAEGFCFPVGYARAQARSLESNERAWKTQWMLVYLYVVLLYRIVKARKGDSIPAKLLAELRSQDVPIFSGCIMLCCLGSYLRKNQKVRLVGDDNSAYSYLNSFISLHGSGKGESQFDENYLRNRVGDLSLWYALGSLLQNGFRPAGESVLITQDKALSKFILRCLPGVQISGLPMAFTFDERVFDDEHRDAIIEQIEAVVPTVSPTQTRQKQLERMSSLRDYVKRGADQELVEAVDRVWEEWLTPGFNLSFQ